MLKESEVEIYNVLGDDPGRGTTENYFSEYFHDEFDLDDEDDRELVELFKLAADKCGRLGCYIISGIDGNFEPVVVIDSENRGHYCLRYEHDTNGIVISPQFYYESLPIKGVE